MKSFLLIILFFYSAYLTSYAQTETYQGKPVNAVDGSNMKQGLWVKFAPGDKTKVLEEGTYKDNKKEGIWKEYYDNGNLKSEITYVSNKPDGYAKLYYESVKLSEEGIWKGVKWVGNYKYYHENGKIAIEGDWKDGKEAGVIKEYYPDGTLKTEKNFNDGKLDESSVKTYTQSETNVKKNDVVTEKKEKDDVVTEKKDDSKEVKVVTNPTNPSDYKAYLSELAKKYPEGVTTENSIEGKNIVTRIIVVRKGSANEYKKVTTSWGQTFYYKNGVSISVSVFQIETKP